MVSRLPLAGLIGRSRPFYPEAIHREPKWLWFVQTQPATPPNSGVASSLEDAKAAFKRRYTEVKGSEQP
jgi:hypothetical protein